MIQMFGSFATVWIILWVLLSLLVIAVYPLLRHQLFKLNVAYAANVLLCIMALPMVVSLICTALLFIPAFESVLVRDHCHANCGAHLPLLESGLMSWPGIIVLSLLIAYFAAKFIQQLKFARSLNRQLLTLSENNADGRHRLLADVQPLVFTVGWWRNTIYISQGILAACNQRELDIIHAHEHAHGIRKDNLRILTSRLLTLLLPKKLAGKLLDDFQVLVESACDFQAAEKYGALPVAETFLKIQRLMPTAVSVPYGVSAINGSPIEARVMALLENQQLYRPTRIITLSCFAIVVAALSLAIDPLHHGIEQLLVLL